MASLLQVTGEALGEMVDVYSYRQRTSPEGVDCTDRDLAHLDGYLDTHIEGFLEAARRRDSISFVDAVDTLFERAVQEGWSYQKYQILYTALLYDYRWSDGVAVPLLLRGGGPRV